MTRSRAPELTGEPKLRGEEHDEQDDGQPHEDVERHDFSFARDAHARERLAKRRAVVARAARAQARRIVRDARAG